MTDNEIMATLRRCADYACYRCTEYGKQYCNRTVAAFAWDLIDRQRAEIERLTERNFDLSEKGEKVCIAYKELSKKYELAVTEREANVKGFTEQLSRAKAEAIKEFAERLCEGRVSNDAVVIATKCLVKEMTGDATEPSKVSPHEICETGQEFLSKKKE